MTNATTTEVTTEMGELVAWLVDRVSAVEERVSGIRLRGDNVNAAFEDDTGWVFRDNLRHMVEQIAVTHVELGRLLAVVDRIEGALPISGNDSLRGH